MKISNKSFTILGKIVLISIAPAKTVWFHNSDRKAKCNMRMDDLFSIKRVYYREIQTYAYKLVVGRVAVLVGGFK